MATKPSKKEREEGRLATPEENRKDVEAAAPEKDELQLKREALADEGLAHGSLNNYKPDQAEAEVAGEVDEEDLEKRNGEEAGNAQEGKKTNVGTSIEDEKAAGTPAGEAAKKAEADAKKNDKK